MKTLMFLAWLGGTGADAVSTHVALNHGAHELVMTQNPAVDDILIGGQAVGGAIFLARLHKTHPRTAVVVGVVAGSFRAYIAYHNIQAIRTKP